MGGACGAYGWGEGVYRVLLGKSEGKRPLGRPRRRWVDNIRIDLQEVVCGYMDWIGLAQDRDRWRTLVSAVMNLRVSWNAGIFLTSCKPVSSSRRTLHHGVSKCYVSCVPPVYCSFTVTEQLLTPFTGDTNIVMLPCAVSVSKLPGSIKPHIFFGLSFRIWYWIDENLSLQKIKI